MSNNFKRFRKEIIQVCPEAEKYYLELDKALEEEHECTNCVINKILKPINALIADKQDKLPKQLFRNFERKTCLECVYKHVGKAILQLGETLSGYDHIDLAKYNIIKAMRNAESSVSKNKLGNALSEINKIKIPTAVDRIQTVINILNGILEETGERRRWMIVANLSEGEDECGDVIIRNEIRVLRVQFENGDGLEVSDLEEILSEINEKLST